MTLIEEITNRKKQLVDDAISKQPPSMQMTMRDQWWLSIQIKDDPIVKALTSLMIAKRQFENTSLAAFDNQ